MTANSDLIPDNSPIILPELFPGENLNVSYGIRVFTT